MLLDGLSFVEAAGTNVKNSDVDRRLARRDHVITLSLASSEVELHADRLGANPASGNPETKIVSLGGARGAITAATTTWRVTRALLEEGGHAHLLVRGLQGGVDAVPVVPGRVQLLEGAEVSGSHFQNQILG